MTQADVARMALEAGMTTMAHDSRIARFASLAVAAQREKLAHWMTASRIFWTTSARRFRKGWRLRC
jgi:hypothetical protein